jgi:mono/diheme cytochrome c family protein
MAQQLLVQRGATPAAAQLKQLALAAPDWRTKLHALWTLDGVDAIDTATIEKALGDKSPDVRAAAIRISERWLREPNHPLQAAVMRRADDENWIVRRQLTASLGELPPVARLTPLTQMLQRYGVDPIVVDAAVSGLAGQEMIVMDRLLQGTATEQKAADAISMLAAADAGARNQYVVQRSFDLAAETNRPAWQRLALLRGVETGLGGGDRRGGGFGGLGGLGGPGGLGASNELALTSEPQSLLAVAKGSGELAELAGRIAARLNWPGKPAGEQAPSLSPAEKARVAAGAEIYANFCAGCHRENGEGNPQGGAKSLVSSQLVTANPAAVMRVILGGKDGPGGLMPPLRGSLNDEQVAAVVSYIRRAWGHTASLVTAADVQETRGITSLRKMPWSDEELAPFTRGRLRPAPPARP